MLLAVVNPQQGHIIRKDSAEVHNLMYVVKYKIVLLCAVLKVMSENS